MGSGGGEEEVKKKRDADFFHRSPSVRCVGYEGKRKYVRNCRVLSTGRAEMAKD